MRQKAFKRPRRPGDVTQVGKLVGASQVFDVLALVLRDRLLVEWIDI